MATVVPPRRKKLTTDNADWTKSDVQISREVGLSRERIRQIRKELGILPRRKTRPAHAEKAALVLEEHKEEVPFYTVVQFRAKFNLSCPIVILASVGKSKGLHFARRNTFPFGLLDWRLPNQDLSLIWKVKPQAVARIRKVPARYDLRTNLSPEDEAERTALQEEAKGVLAKYVNIHGQPPDFNRSGPISPLAFPWREVSWRLSNKDIAEIWGRALQYVSSRRVQLGRGPAFIGELLSPGTPEYETLLEEENERAKNWRMNAGLAPM